ncbi:hypothetical protein Acsp02_48910 [Actinoplanes sp. NBRC 103695]|nr:hypothetical protein Acsp02_48910 [Actinoplanes sp. NBRC 103695]
MTTAPAPTKKTTRPAPRRRFTADTGQAAVLVVIVLFVGLMAGAASFNHVKEWTLDNSPAGTDEWFGWANAVISELIPTAAIIEIGRRRRRDKQNAKVGYPMALLIGAVLFSLTAQLAVAKPGLSGWVVSALPALAFLGLSKLVFTATATAPRPTTKPVAATKPAASPASPSGETRAKARPAAASTTRATPAKKTAAAKKTPSNRPPAKKTAPEQATPTPAVPEAAPAPAPAEDAPRYPQALLDNARAIAASHLDSTGEPISTNKMAVRLRVDTATAEAILLYLETNPPKQADTTARNGSTMAGANA